MKSILQKILAYLARATIRRYHPVVVGITGSVGKTSTRQAVFTVLKKQYRVRTAEKNYNNEIGLPLTILGIPHYGRNVVAWVLAFIRIGISLMAAKGRYPEVLVLEYGVDQPHDMERLIQIARPYIAVVTAMGDIPVHVEFFQDPEELAAEKAKLVAAVPVDGTAILNLDDDAVYHMKGKALAKVVTFGVDEHADFRIVAYRLQTIKDVAWGDMADGISFKIESAGHLVPFRLHDTFGFPTAYAAVAAVAVGSVMGVNLLESSEAFRHYYPPAGRLRLIKGVKGSLILDDTYNAAPESTRAALETLRDLPGKRKIAVLGDMLELGRYSEQAHRAIGDCAAGFVDMLVAVGPRAKFIADEARTRGVEREARVLDSDRMMWCDDALSAGMALKQFIRGGDLILVKGSQAMRMEKVVEEVMAHPEQAGELLVRQDDYWKRS